MSLSDQLDSQIRRDQQQPQEVQVQHGAASVRVRIRSAGPIGCSLDELEVRSANLAGADAPAKACRRIERKVDYLQEPLKILEQGPAGEIQMRSREPRQRGDSRHYSEIDANTERLKLSRYAKRPGAPREPTPLDVTHESLHRLVDDLVEALGENPA